uniref:Pecanex-like protein n=2 Tax=Iconisemion striatum TaxID=60296 RepID=A0A1A7WWY0_9TELE
MGSQVVQTLRQGVWASLTGGWYHDPDQNKFNNCCHLYLWIFLLMLPLSLHLALPPTTMALSIYCTSITVFFIFIKLANYRLHLMFDEGEVVVRSLSDLSKAQEKKASDSCLPASIRKSSTVPDSVAMTTLTRKRLSPVIQVTVKQTETDPGLIGVDNSKSDEVKTAEGQGETAAEEKSAEGGLQPNTELSPDDISSPNPEQDAPLLQAQQRPSSRDEGEDLCPGSACGTTKLHAPETGAVTEGVDVQNSSAGKTDQSEERRESEKDLEQDRTEEKEDKETGDEGLPPSRGSEDESESSKDSKESSDANNNSLDSPKDDQDEFIDIPEFPLAEPVEEAYCSDEIEVVLVDNSSSGSGSAHLDDRDTVKIIITMSCDPQTAAQLEESVKQSLLENAQAQKDAGECHIKIPVITFDSPEKEGREGATGSEEDDPTPKQQLTTSQSEEFHLCREATSSESTILERPEPEREHCEPHMTSDSTPSPQLTNDNSSSGIDVHSHPDDTDPLDPNVDSHGFLRLPPAVGRYGPDGRTHIRGLSMDSGKDLLSERSHNTTIMTSSKSDLEAKEGQIPNESNFLEFISLLGSLSMRGGGASVQEEEVKENKEKVDAEEEENQSTTPGPDATLTETNSENKSERPKPPTSLPTNTPPALPPTHIPIVSPESPQTDREKDPDYDSLPSQTSQSESSMLQVICRPEATNKEEAYTFHTVHRDRPRKLYAERALNLPLGAELITGNMCDLLSTSSNSEGHDGIAGGHTDCPFQRRIIPAHRLRPRRTHPEIFQEEDSLDESSETSTQEKPTKKIYYKLQLCPGKWINILYDRLTLLALLDRNQDVLENLVAVFMAFLVSFLGFVLLNHGCFKDFWVFQFCLVIASCQYSLLKSVQPDAASPTHGHNQLVAYSRAAFFCIFCALIWLLEQLLRRKDLPVSTLYGVTIICYDVLHFIRDLLVGFTYCFPVTFLVGLFPQINTFTIYLLEQVDIHFLGGTAATSLVSAVYSILRSLIALSLLYGFCFGALKEPWDEQHTPALFSSFCGLLVVFSYHLSRQSSDPSVLMSLIKSKIMPALVESEEEEEEEELASEGGEEEEGEKKREEEEVTSEKEGAEEREEERKRKAESSSPHSPVKKKAESSRFDEAEKQPIISDSTLPAVPNPAHIDKDVLLERQAHLPTTHKFSREPLYRVIKNQPPPILSIELDHNPFKCPAPDCSKSFRKASLLHYHIKYYHSDQQLDGGVEPAPARRKRSFSDGSDFTSSRKPEIQNISCHHGDGEQSIMGAEVKKEERKEKPGGLDRKDRKHFLQVKLKKKKKKKKKKSGDGKRRKDEPSNSDCSSDDRSDMRSKQKKKRSAKGRHKNKKVVKTRGGDEDSSSSGDSGDEKNSDRRTNSRKKRKHDSVKDWDSELDSKKKKRKNWKAAGEESSDDSSTD